MEQTAPTPDNFRTVGDLAKALRCGPRTILNAIHRGELRACAINARGDLRVHDAWAAEWLERRASARP